MIYMHQTHYNRDIKGLVHLEDTNSLIRWLRQRRPPLKSLIPIGLWISCYENGGTIP